MAFHPVQMTEHSIVAGVRIVVPLHGSNEDSRKQDLQPLDAPMGGQRKGKGINLHGSHHLEWILHGEVTIMWIGYLHPIIIAYNKFTINAEMATNVHMTTTAAAAATAHNQLFFSATSNKRRSEPGQCLHLLGCLWN